MDTVTPSLTSAKFDLDQEERIDRMSWIANTKNFSLSVED